MIHSFINRCNMVGLLTASLVTFSVTSSAGAIMPQPSSDTQMTKSNPLSYPQYGEWRYNPQSNPPTLMWWNTRMDNAVPVLYISFLPNRIIIDAITPVWPDTGIIFYIKDKTDKLGLNLTLHNKTEKNCYYRAIIYGPDRQSFLNDLVTSRKARLITPSSYSQSLSLKQVYQAMHDMLSMHPDLRLTLPEPTKYSR
ncbi:MULTISPECIES: hypothetical protein [Commensalibacter]|uniref:Lipoprotein n=2 Tax=Commensalibacter TaxID=1079922 RepID=W7DPX3_9PROT|nr:MULTISPECIES: hypothetical protein [Commensalibacter]EUK19412.1 hypothetical protein COMX_06660 [Commensalibacter papalotli (ex Servin-Garciduenas et al. 2014)]CAI3935008.1 unnamed protein product [Commensalibacter papalotli (ex Botero et al. 2024)]CAI3951152.1 unnamed protein product [Commensalibacter papalotli (ex Botero et al. 2024)]